jgi:hypothetical protein
LERAAGQLPNPPSAAGPGLALRRSHGSRLQQFVAQVAA